MGAFPHCKEEKGKKHQGLLGGHRGRPSIMDSGRRLAAVEFTDALNPALHGFGVLLRILKALYFHLLLEMQADLVSGLDLWGWLPSPFPSSSTYGYIMLLGVLGKPQGKYRGIRLFGGWLIQH